MSLTIKEKEHWKERIRKRIDVAVERLKLADVTGELQRLEEVAMKEAKASLGLDYLLERLHELTDRRKQLGERLDSVLGEIRERLGQPKSIGGYLGDGLPYWMEQLISKRAMIHRKPLLEKSEFGRRLLKLEREKEELLDAVWLSTCPKQIKQLWAEVAELLDIEQNDLQKKANEIEAMSDSK